MSKESRTRSLKLNLVEDRDSVSLPFAEDLKIPPLESLRTNHHEGGEFLRGNLQVGLPGEFFDRDPIDVAQVQYGSQPIPSALNTRERKKVLVQTMKQIGELRIMVR
jgi:hypothetical protein